MNKIRNFENWIIRIALLICLTALFSGLLANIVGLDHNSDQGLMRIPLVEVGFLISATSIALLFHRRWGSKTINWIIFCTVLQCVLVYFWYETAGTMKFINSTLYYDMQAQAFLHGQLDLLQKPSPELLALPDPYDPTQNSPYRLHDAVLYNGKYYLYWGPFPALLLAGMKLATNLTFSDSILVLLFMSGNIMFLSLILMELSRKTFPISPNWILVSSVLIGGLMNPALWLLARPAIYEASITGGQFCLLAGIFFGLTAFEVEGFSTAKLILSGAFLAFSVLSRISLVLAVFWVAVGIGFTIIKRLVSLKRALKPVLAFSIPLMLGATMLFMYNVLRFGSPFEIGTRYQLAGIDIRKIVENGSYISPMNILPSLNTYFFFPTQKIPTFPLIVAPWNGDYNLDLINAALNSPNRFMLIEPIAGVMNTSPVLWFAILPVPFCIDRILRRKLTKDHLLESEKFDGSILSNKTWLFHLLIGLVVFTFMPISIIFAPTMRYIFDFSPSLYLLAYMGLLFGRMILKPKWEKNIITICFLALGLITIINGMLLGITSYFGYFSSNNPELFKVLVGLFSYGKY